MMKFKSDPLPRPDWSWNGEAHWLSANYWPIVRDYNELYQDATERTIKQILRGEVYSAVSYRGQSSETREGGMITMRDKKRKLTTFRALTREKEGKK